MSHRGCETETWRVRKRQRERDEGGKRKLRKERKVTVRRKSEHSAALWLIACVGVNWPSSRVCVCVCVCVTN